MGSLLVLSAVVIHFIMPGLKAFQILGNLTFGSSEVPQPPADADKPGMFAALQKPGILVALFKVSILLTHQLFHLKVYLGEHGSL